MAFFVLSTGSARALGPPVWWVLHRYRTEGSLSASPGAGAWPRAPAQ